MSSKYFRLRERKSLSGPAGMSTAQIIGFGTDPENNPIERRHLKFSLDERFVDPMKPFAIALQTKVRSS